MYFIAKKNHFKDSFAHNLPQELNDFVDPPEDENEEPAANCPVNPEMVTPPALGKHVFAKINQTVPKVAHGLPGVQDNLRMGDVVFLPYDRCDQLINNGYAELT